MATRLHHLLRIERGTRLIRSRPACGEQVAVRRSRFKGDLNESSVPRRLCCCCRALCAAGAHAHDKADSIVRFHGAIGSQPFANVGGLPAPNDVLGIAPGGRPWELRKLRASVATDGTLRAKGTGLLLGGGGNIGRPAIPRNIQATLFCGTGATPPSWNSGAVALDENGDFSSHGPLTAVGATTPVLPPNPCVAPILLIRNSTSATTPGGLPTPGPWFAAGIVASGNDD